MSYKIGLDPGVKGAISILDSSGMIVDYRQFPQNSDDSPDLTGTAALMKSMIPPDSEVWLEEIHALGLVKASSNFKLGTHFGFLQGVLLSMDIMPMFVKPKTWQKKIWQINEYEWTNPGEKDTKVISLKAAQRLFPGNAFIDPECKRCYVANDGIVDACLIAYYGHLNSK